MCRHVCSLPAYLRSPSHPATAGQLPTEPWLQRNLQMRTDAAQRGFGFPSENESCRHTLHKPPLPLVESSIIIKLDISTQQGTFWSSLILSLYSFSCFSRLSLSSTVKSSSSFSPSQASISSCSQLFRRLRMRLRGRLIKEEIRLNSINKVYYCSEGPAPSLSSHQGASPCALIALQKLSLSVSFSS